MKGKLELLADLRRDIIPIIHNMVHLIFWKDHRGRTVKVKTNILLAHNTDVQLNWPFLELSRTDA